MPEITAPPMLICTKFGLGVRDPAWFDHRLILTAAITVPSILSQRDQNLHWAWFVDEDLPMEVRSKAEDMLAPFAGRAFLESGPPSAARMLRLAKERGLVDPSGRVLTSRIDDDDAWSVDTVGLVRRKVMEWKRNDDDARGLGVTFERGFEWIMYDMLDIDRLQEKGRRVIHSAAIREYTYPFHSMSVHVYAPEATGLTAMAAAHSRMGATLSKRGCSVEVASTNDPMWLYCRHKQIDSSVKKARGGAVDLKLHELAERFGVDEDKAGAYLETSNNHGYATLKRPPAEFGKINRKIAEVRRQRRIAADGEVLRLDEEEQRLRNEMHHLAENIVGELGDVDEPINRDPPG